MSHSSGREKHRRKRLKSEKFEKRVLKSFLFDLLGSDGSHRRKKSPSSSGSSSSIDGSRGSHRDKENRRRNKRRTKRGTSSRRKRSRSRSFDERSTDVDASRRNEASSSANVSKIKKVTRDASSTSKRKNGADESNTDVDEVAETEETKKFPTVEHNSVPAQLTVFDEAQQTTDEKTTTKTTATSIKNPNEGIVETNTVSENSEETKNIMTQEEAVDEPTKTEPVVETVEFVLKNIPEPVAESEIDIEEIKTTASDAPIPDAAASSKDSIKAQAENEKVKMKDERKSLEAKRIADREKLVQVEYTNLVEAWKSIVKQGLSNAATEKLLRTYCLGEDSEGFKAPILNPGLKSLLNGCQIVADDWEIAKQNQLGASIKAIQVAAHRIVNGNHRSSDLARIVVTTNDVACTMAQLHYSTSIARRRYVLENLEIEGIEIENCIGETLFDTKEEKEIVEKFLDRRLLEDINEEVEKRLAATEKNAEEVTKENEAPPPSEKETDEQSNGPCSQRFGASRHSKLTIVQSKQKTEKDVKPEEKLKSNKKTMPNEFDASEKFPGFVEMTRMARIRQGFPEIAIPVVMNVLAPSTSKTYEKHMEKWWDFSHRETVDTFDPRMHDVMEFLTELWNNGATVNTLNSVRSALSWITSKDLGKNEDLAMLYRGFAKKCI